MIMIVLEKEMATHSSVLAWRIPGTGEPGGLPSLGLHPFEPINLKVKILNIFMASLDPWIKSSPFFMPPGHFTMDQIYGLKINDHQLFFPQANGTEFNYCPSMDILQVVQNIPIVCFIPDKNFVNLVHAP